MDDNEDEFRCQTIDAIDKINRHGELVNSIEEFYQNEGAISTATIGYYPEASRTKGWSPQTFNTKIFEKFRYESPLLSGYFPRLSKEDASFLRKFELRVRLIPNKEDVMFLEYSKGPQWQIEKIPDRTDGYRHFFHRMFVKDFPSLYPDSGLKNIYVDVSYGIRDHVLVERNNANCTISNVYSVPAVRTYSCSIIKVTNTNMIPPVSISGSDYYTNDERPVTIPVTSDDLYNILIDEDSSDSDSDENVNSLSQLSIGSSSSELLVLEKEQTARIKKFNNNSIFKVPNSIIQEALKDATQKRLPFKPVVKSSVPTSTVKKTVIKKKRGPVQKTLSPFFRKPSKSSRLSSQDEDEENEEQ